MKTATLASALQSTANHAEARQALADTAAELVEAGVRGRGLQTALMLLLRSALTMANSTEGSFGAGSRSYAVADVQCSFWRCSDGRTADDTLFEACAGALAVLLRDDDDSVCETAARCAVPWLFPYPCSRAASLLQKWLFTRWLIRLARDALHRELMAVLGDLRNSQPSKSAAPLRHARLLMLEAQALAARPAASGHEVQAALDAAMDLFKQAAARQVTVHPADPPDVQSVTLRTSPLIKVLSCAVAGQGLCNTPGLRETDR